MKLEKNKMKNLRFVLLLLIGIVLIGEIVIASSEGTVEINKTGKLVFLVTTNDFPDAAAASVAAAKLGGVIIATEKDSISTDVENAIREYDPDQILIIGGPLAISTNVESQINSLGYETVRIAGETRYETASEIARAFWDESDEVFLVGARGRAHADAMSVIPLAALKNAPILYTETKNLSNATKRIIEDLKVKNIVIVGGSLAVSDHVENELKSIGKNVDRKHGLYAHDTSRIVAEEVLSILKEREMPVDHAIIAVTKDNADLVAGNLAVETQSPVLIIPEGTKVPETIKDFMIEHGMNKTTLIGSNETLPVEIEDELERADILVGRIKGRHRVEISLRTHEQVKVMRRAIEKAIERANQKFGDLDESFDEIHEGADEISEKDVRIEIINEMKESSRELFDSGKIPEDIYDLEKENLDEQESELEDERYFAKKEVEDERDEIMESVNDLTDDEIDEILDYVKSELNISDVVLPKGIVRRLCMGKELPPGIENVIDRSIGFSKHYRERTENYESLKGNITKEIEDEVEKYKKEELSPERYREQCLARYNISLSTTIFYYSTGSRISQKMSSSVKMLQGVGGYEVYWIDVSDKNASKVVEECLSDLIDIGGRTPQFTCPANEEMHTGEFTEMGLRRFIGNCHAYREKN